VGCGPHAPAAGARAAWAWLRDTVRATPANKARVQLRTLPLYDVYGLAAAGPAAPHGLAAAVAVRGYPRTLQLTVRALLRHLPSPLTGLQRSHPGRPSWRMHVFHTETNEGFVRAALHDVVGVVYTRCGTDTTPEPAAGGQWADAEGGEALLLRGCFWAALEGARTVLLALPGTVLLRPAVLQVRVISLESSPLSRVLTFLLPMTPPAGVPCRAPFSLHRPRAAAPVRARQSPRRGARTL